MRDRSRRPRRAERPREVGRARPRVPRPDGRRLPEPLPRSTARGARPRSTTWSPRSSITSTGSPDAIAFLREHGRRSIEAEPDAERSWSELVDEVGGRDRLPEGRLLVHGQQRARQGADVPRLGRRRAAVLRARRGDRRRTAMRASASTPQVEKPSRSWSDHERPDARGAAPRRPGRGAGAPRPRRASASTSAAWPGRGARWPASCAPPGVARGDRVVLVVPDGPVLLQTLLAVVTLGAAAAPLNPAYTHDEYVFFMEDLSPRLALLAAGEATAARAASSVGVGVGELRRRGRARGRRADRRPGRAHGAGLRARRSRTTSPCSCTRAAPRAAPSRSRSCTAT